MSLQIERKENGHVRSLDCALMSGKPSQSWPNYGFQTTPVIQM